jgi:hypothetical protein
MADLARLGSPDPEDPGVCA